MARILTSGAEWKDNTVELNPTGATAAGAQSTATYDTAAPISGLASFKNGTTSWALCSTPGTLGITLGHTIFARLNFKVDAYPTLAASLLSFRDTTNASYLPLGVPSPAISLNTDGTLSLANGSVIFPAISLNTVYTVELSLNIATGSVDALAWRVNGVLQESFTNLALSDTAIGYARISVAGGGNNTWYDDLAVNDDTGATQNTWPGTGNVVLLKPISDSAVGTGWTLGTGTAISAGSGSTAVKNTPPLGVADLTAGSDTKQIRNASSNANVNYDANLTSYTNAGVPAGATINVVVPMIATGAPVVTSAKAGTVGVVSNPAIANVSLGAGGTAGAFWSGVAAGTYPTGWKWSLGTTTYAPSVTPGTSPVMRVTQVTASTRIADVCAMGMYVDYTPAVVTLPFNTSEGEDHSDPRSLQIMDRVGVARGAVFCLGEKWARKGRLWIPAADRPLAVT